MYFVVSAQSAVNGPCRDLTTLSADTADHNMYRAVPLSAAAGEVLMQPMCYYKTKTMFGSHSVHICLSVCLCVTCPSLTRNWSVVESRSGCLLH